MSDAAITQICTTVGIIFLAYIGYLKLKLNQDNMKKQIDTHVASQEVRNDVTTKQLDVIEKQGNGTLKTVAELNQKIGRADQKAEDDAKK